MATLLLAGLGTSAAAQAVLPWAEVGAWAVNFHRKADGCLAATAYPDGTTFLIGYGREDGARRFRLGLVNPGWAATEPGEDYPIQIQFGEVPGWELTMEGLEGAAPALSFSGPAEDPVLVELVAAFRSEEPMRIGVGGIEIGYHQLTGAAAAFASVEACQAAWEERPAGDRGGTGPAGE